MYDTLKVASMYPKRGRKKNCTPLLACSSVSSVGLVGLPTMSLIPPSAAVPTKVRVAMSTWTAVPKLAPDMARSGVLKYSYAGTVSSSMYSPLASASISYAVIDASASWGRMRGSFIAAQE